MTELKPCPFCGSESVVARKDMDYSFFCVFCHEKGCYAEGPYRATKENAIIAWNTRHETN